MNFSTKNLVNVISTEKSSKVVTLGVGPPATVHAKQLVALLLLNVLILAMKQTLCLNANASLERK